MVGKLATIHGLGVDTADMLVSEVFYRDIPDQGAIPIWRIFSYRKLLSRIEDLCPG